VHNSAPFSQNVTMNKRELAKSVAVHADVELKTVAAVLDGFTDVVTAVVSKGEPVSIPGFAKFVKVDRAARMGRNPATGETIRIKASKKARITPVKAFKDAVLAPTTAPKLKKGAYPLDAAAVAAAGKSAAVAPVRGVVAKAPAKKAPAKKAPAKKAPAAKKAIRRAPAKKAPVAKKVVRRAAPAKKAPVAKKVVRRAPAKKAVKRAR
jgi:DNA-binding protein HU-beta